MNILSLTSENIKRLQVVQITPKGHVVVIGGRNAQGKTSVLDSITMALGGGKSIPEKPIRKGQKSAEIILDLGELVVIRKFSETAGPSLVVKGADGVSLKSPQAILDKLTSRIAFDPLGFIRMEPFAQKDTLQKLVGLNFATQDAERVRIYSNRTVKNRELDSAKHKVQTLPNYPNAPTKADSPTALLEEIQKANEHNNRKATLEEKAIAAEERVTRLNAQQGEAKRELELAKSRFEAAKANADEAIQYWNDLDAQIEAFTEIPTADLVQRIATAEETARQVACNVTRAEAIATLLRLEKESQEMTAGIEAIDKAKTDALAAAQFPVEGLGFDDTSVTFNALPFTQASDAEKLRVSVAMGIAMNPKLKVLLIRDGSLLDDENLALIGEMAERHGAQVWIERVGEGKEVSVVIEDGRVKDSSAAVEDLSLEATK